MLKATVALLKSSGTRVITQQPLYMTVCVKMHTVCKPIQDTHSESILLSDVSVCKHIWQLTVVLQLFSCSVFQLPSKSPSCAFNECKHLCRRWWTTTSVSQPLSVPPSDYIWGSKGVDTVFAYSNTRMFYCSNYIQNSILVFNDHIVLHVNFFIITEKFVFCTLSIR